MSQYGYGYDANHNLVIVSSLTKEDRKRLAPFTCIGCGEELIARLGEINVKHFAHKHSLECNGETYLHKLSKVYFYRTYQRCLEQNQPFNLVVEYSQHCDFFEAQFGECCKRTLTQTHDLTKFFTSVALEQKDGEFIPDALLSSRKGERLYIEMAVTHFSSEEKINSGTRILEFRIESEDDLKLFSSANVETSDQSVGVFNFDNSKPKENLCDGACSRGVRIFIVYPSGKSIIADKRGDKIQAQLEMRSPVFTKLVGFSDLNLGGGEYKDLVREAYFSGTPISNCYLCKFHGAGMFEQPIFCKLKRVGVPSNVAVDCESYSAFKSEKESERADHNNKVFAEKRSSLKY